MAVQLDACISEAIPKRLGLCAQQVVIALRRRLMFCQSVRRLIDANHPGLRKLCGQNGCAHTSAAKGVEHDGSWVLTINLYKFLERFASMCRAGLFPGVLLVMPHNIPQVGMGCDLIGLQHWFVSSFGRCLRSSSHLAIIPRICRPTDPNQPQCVKIFAPFG